MSRRLTVWVAPTLPAVAGRAVLASLPMSFEEAHNPDRADVLVVDGQQPGWTDRLLASAGRQVVVVDPSVAESPAAAFLLDTPWGSNPVCAGAAEAFRATSWSRLECRAVVPVTASPRLELLRLVCLTRAVGLPAGQLRILLRTPAGLVAIGSSGDQAIHVDLALTDAIEPQVVLRALTEDGDVTVTIPSPQTARPAELVVTDASGSATHPTSWEDAHRATWRRILRGTPTDDSRGFRADQQLVTAAFAHKE